MKITPNLFVQSIEEALPFWIGRLGFTKTVEVPLEDSKADRIGFVILNHGEAELMLQSIESVAKDVPAFVPDFPVSGQGLFIEVDSAAFAAIVKALDGYPIALEQRTTFYGMTEIGVRAPDGHIVVFATR
jgi:catechol 2,3-dioxygenase-like lactoylglutathione lyase family enzyme